MPARVANSSAKSKSKIVQIEEIEPLKAHGSTSNLAAPTYLNPARGRKKQLFNVITCSVSDESGKYVVPRKLLKNKSGYPYRKARVVNHSNDISKEWHIVFYLWDIGQQKLVRKRVCKQELNSIRDLKKRSAKAKELVEELNQDLQTGYLETEPKETATVQAFNFHGYKLLDAITYVANHKKEVERKGRSTWKEYNYTKTTLIDFFTHAGLPNNYLLRQVSNDFINRYLIYLREVRNVSNKTYNDRINNLHTAVQTLRKLDLKLWPLKNPFADIAKLSVKSKKHAAYTTDQIEKFKEVIAPRDAQLLLFLQLIYFTLARPNELRFLKVGHIVPEHNKILFVGEHAKTDIEEYVGMNETLKQLIVDSGILQHDPNHFVFTTAGCPGPVPTGTGYFYKRFRIYLASLGFRKLNSNYTLYSFKHSGAIQLFLATKDAYLVQRQCRHTTLDQTNTYLKDLGLFTDFRALDKWKGF